MIPNSVTDIGEGAFHGCRSLTSVTIPNSVTSIKYYTFNGCSSLTSVTIPDGVTSIGNEAFSNCSGLISVTIGKGIETVGTGAFASCLELTDVYCYAENVPIMKDYWSNTPCTDAFDGSYIEKATLHVPTASIKAYKSTKPWSGFKNIVDIVELNSSVNDMKTQPVMIQATNGVITVTGVDDGIKVEVFGMNGVLAGSAYSHNGTATVSTTLQTGTTTIVKIGSRSVKTIMRDGSTDHFENWRLK